MTRRFFALMLAALLSGITGCPKPPAASNAADAKRLVEIGDYAQALPKLLELSKTDPENVEVRLLMAQAFAECGQALEVPGLQSVGKNNAERAAYHLQVLAKLGDDGGGALCKAIADGDEHLAPLAVEAAGNVGMEEAIDAIGAFLKRTHANDASEKKAITALTRIGGNRAADLIQRRMDYTANPSRRNRLAETCVRCYDSEGRIKLAGKTTDRKLLHALIRLSRSLPDAVELLTIIAQREDLNPEMTAWVRLRAVSELWRLAPEAVITPLADLSVDASQSVQRECLDRLRSALGSVASRDKAQHVALLEELSKHKSPAARWLAMEQLVAAAPEKAVAPLCNAIKDRAKGKSAVKMLERTKSRKALKTLFEVLEALSDPKRSKDWPVARDSVCAAVIACGAKSDELLRAIRLMDKPGPAGERYRLRDFFDRVKSQRPEELEAFVAGLMADKNARLREYGATHGLPLLPIAARVKLALTIINNENADTRMHAFQTLREGNRLGLVKADVLIPLLRSEHKGVVRGVAQALSKKPAKTASKAMFELLKDSTRSKYAMRELAMFFEKVPDKRAADAFTWEIVSKSPAAPVETLAKAVKACSSDLPASAKEIARALQDEAHSVRMNAVKALGILADKSVLPDLFKALRKATSSREKRALTRLIESLGGDPSQPDESPGKKTEDA